MNNMPAISWGIGKKKKTEQGKGTPVIAKHSHRYKKSAEVIKEAWVLEHFFSNQQSRKHLYIPKQSFHPIYANLISFINK